MGIPTRSLIPKDLPPQLPPQWNVEGGEGFVEQQRPGLRREGAGQRHALLLTAGELARSAVGHVGDPERLHGVRRGVLPLLAGLASHTERHVPPAR